MELELTKIDYSTNIKDFPKIHNDNVDALIKKINELETTITQKDAQISTLISNFNQTINSLDAKYQALFSQKMAEFEDTFVKKEDNQ